MKTLMLFLIVSSVFAAPQTSLKKSLHVEPTPLSECDLFIRDVLSAGVVEHEAADETYQFVKDEKRAREIIQNFDVKKFAFEKDKAQALKDLKTCSATTLSCSPILSTMVYLNALIFGMRHYAWSKETIALGLGNIRDFAREVRRTEGPFLNLIVAAAVLKKAAENRLLKDPDSTKLTQLVRDLDRDRESLEYHGTPKKQNPTCSEIQALAEQELKVVRANINRLDPFLD